MDLEGPARTEPDSLLKGPKRAALLVYLCVAQPKGLVRRDSLLALLWPDLDQERGRHALRNTLHVLRGVLGRESIRNRGKEEVGLREDFIWFDAAAFDDALSSGRLEEAAQLYEGEFLRGFHVRGVAPAFQHWMDTERERLALGYRRALEELAVRRTRVGQHREAAELWRRLVREDPLSERFVISLMQALAASADPSAALREAESHIEWLRQEYDAPAPAGVVELARALRKGEYPVAGSPWRPHGSSGAPGRSAPQSGSASRLVPGTAQMELPLVGREEEWRRLQAAWIAASGGSAGFVSISGVAGIGKTRLALEHVAWAAENGFATARARCHAVEGGLAYAPVAEWLRSESLLEASLGLQPIWLTEIARVVPEVLARQPNLDRPEPLTESWERRQLFEALAHGILASSRPVTLLIDDLQWCDVETLDWLRFLFRFAPDAPLLVVGTIRDDELGPDQPWKSFALGLRERGQLTDVPLGRLDRKETGALAAQIATRELEPTQADRVFRETEGNPLFVVEAVRAGLLDSDRPDATATAEAKPIPPRVQAVIEHRLSQLSPQARDLAGLAATLGHPFDARLLNAASSLDEEALARSLDELWSRRIVRGESTDVFDFTHDKLREVAGGLVSPARRTMLHRRIAEALESIRGPDLDPISGRLANHYQQAGLTGKAVAYYERAARVAHQTHAEEEVVRLLGRALGLLDRLPASEARDDREVRMLVALGTGTVSARGWAAREAGEAFERAGELLRRGRGMPDELVTTVWGLHAFHVVRGHVRDATSETASLWDQAYEQDIPLVGPVGRFNEAMIDFHSGSFARAKELLELIVFDASVDEHYRLSRFLPLETLTLSYLSHASWFLADEEGALKYASASVTSAREGDNPFALGMALAYAAMLHQFRRDVGAVRKNADAAWATCDAYGLRYYQAWASILRGWARGAEDDVERGRNQLQTGLDDLRATGAGLRLPYYLGLRADLCLRAGDLERGMDLVTRGIDIGHTYGELWCAPELLCLRAQLLERAGNEAGAEEAWRQAVADAREQGSHQMEVRARRGLRALGE